MGILYTYSLFQPYVMDYFGIASTGAVAPFTVSIAGGFIGGLIGGVLQKRSIKLTLLVGYLIELTGLFASSVLAPGIPAMLTITYGVLVGVGNGVVYNVLLSLITRWFPDRKGVATGIALAMVAGGTVIFSPVCSMLLAGRGLLGTYRILGFVFVPIAALALATLKNPPEGYLAEYSAGAAGAKSTAVRECRTIGDVLRTRDYYFVTGMYLFCMPAYMLMNAIFVSYGLSDKALAEALVVLGVSGGAIAQAVGRLLVTSASDKVGRKWAMVADFSIMVVAVFLLFVGSGYLYIGAFWLLALSYGGAMATMPSIATDRLGNSNAGQNISLTQVGQFTGTIGITVLAAFLTIPQSIVIGGISGVLGVVCALALYSRDGKAPQGAGQEDAMAAAKHVAA